MRRGHRRLVAVLAAASFALTTAQATHAVDTLDWTVAAGFPVLFNDATVTVETTMVPAEDADTIEPYAIQRINIVNDSASTRYFSFGMDIQTQSVIEPLWQPETLGETELDRSSPFVVALSPGEELADIPGHLLYYGMSTDVPGIPIHPGRTAVVYELSDDPWTDPDVTAIELARVTSPGGFVPIDVDGDATQDGTVPAGVPVTVVGPTGDDVQLSHGVTVSVTASDLPSNLDVELWLVPSTDYFSFLAEGSRLPDSAYRVGTATTAADGTLDTAFEVPADADVDLVYRLFVGVPEDRYWPAGTYRGFQVTPPRESDAASAASDDTSATLAPGPATVEFTFPKGTGGTWTAVASTTGPTTDEFAFAGDSPRYYHLDTTAS